MKEGENIKQSLFSRKLEKKMKKTVQQLIKKTQQEPIEIAKTAFEQVSSQGVKREEERREGEGFREASARIQQLEAREKGYQEKAIPEIREKLGISASGKASQTKKPQQTPGKAPAMPSPYEASLTAQIEKLRKEVMEKETAEKAEQAREGEERRKKEEAAKQELQIPPSRRPEKVAPWARKIKAGQGTGELRPSFGKQ